MLQHALLLLLLLFGLAVFVGERRSEQQTNGRITFVDNGRQSRRDESRDHVKK